MTSLRRILRRSSSAELQAALPASLHPVLRRVYAARPLSGADDLALRLDQLLPVSTLDGAESAADLLASARRTGRRVLVVGDFDADGMMASAILAEAVATIGGRAAVFIPDRSTEGYGFTLPALERCLREHPAATLVVTVDCGISQPDSCDLAASTPWSRTPLTQAPTARFAKPKPWTRSSSAGSPR